jgi:hypothetical protein
MPTSVGLVAGEFLYKNRVPLDAEESGVILVGEVHQGTITPRMHLQVGSRTIPIIGVEGYGKSPNVDQGLLVLTATLEDVEAVEGLLQPNTHYFVLQHVSMAPSPMQTTFRSVFSELLQWALTPPEQKTT